MPANKSPKPVCRVEYRTDVRSWAGSNSGEPRAMPPEIWFRLYANKAVEVQKLVLKRGYKCIQREPDIHLFKIPATETARIEEEIAFLRPLTRLRFTAGAGLRHGNETERAKAAVEQEDLDQRWAQWERHEQRKRMVQAAHYEAVQVAQAIFESYLSPNYHDERRQWRERLDRLHKTLGDYTAPFLRKVLRVATGRGGWTAVKANDLMAAADAIVTGPDTPEKQRLMAACGKG
jgi:hypothetical protein